MIDVEQDEACRSLSADDAGVLVLERSLEGDPTERAGERVAEACSALVLDERLLRRQRPGPEGDHAEGRRKRERAQARSSDERLREEDEERGPDDELGGIDEEGSRQAPRAPGSAVELHERQPDAADGDRRSGSECDRRDERERSLAPGTAHLSGGKAVQHREARVCGSAPPHCLHVSKACSDTGENAGHGPADEAGQKNRRCFEADARALPDREREEAIGCAQRG